MKVLCRVILNDGSASDITVDNNICSSEATLKIIADSVGGKIRVSNSIGRTFTVLEELDNR